MDGKCECQRVLDNVHVAKKKWGKLLRVDKAAIREYHKALSDYADLFWNVRMYRNEWVPNLRHGEEGK